MGRFLVCGTSAALGVDREAVRACGRRCIVASQQFPDSQFADSHEEQVGTEWRDDLEQVLTRTSHGPLQYVRIAEVAAGGREDSATGRVRWLRKRESDNC